MIRVLGAGGMGTVYLCLQAQPQREVVIKFPHPALMQQEGFRERFEAEIRFMIELDHPGVVAIYETGNHQGLPFAVLQYLPGGSLSDRLAQSGSPQSVEEIARWLGPIAATLDSIHQDGVLHRDIKPDNILFDRRGYAFLSDFGISKAIAEISSPSTALTRTGLFVGSPKYAPPEYIDRRFSPACDQYSLAAVVYCAVTGRAPHEATTTERLLVEKATVVPRPASDHAENLPVAAVAALERALAISPENRFANCCEFAAAFTGALVSESAQANDAKTGQTPVPRPGRKWKPAIALISLVVVAAASFLLVQRWNQAQEIVRSETELRLAAENKKKQEAERIRQHSMVAVPAGEFWYGCNERVDSECESDEKPGGTATLPAFAIDRTEVTVAAYGRCVDAGACSAEGLNLPYYADKEQLEFAWACNWGQANRSDHPINCVDWQQAQTFCGWQGARLPNEREWEKAARGTDGRKYAWGNRGYEAATRVANIADESAKRQQSGWSVAAGYDDGYYATAPAGSYPNGASPYGALDMIGNVWEWTSDWYSADQKYRVLRGGSWGREPEVARASYSGWNEPRVRNVGIGFRCAQ